MALDEDDLGILRFERRQWPDTPAKAAAVRDVFGITYVRYCQRLAVLVDNPDALAVDPLLINRLRRIKAARRAPHPAHDRRPESPPRA